MPLVRAKLSGTFPRLAMWPMGQPAGGPCRIPARWRPGSVEKGGGAAGGSPRAVCVLGGGREAPRGGGRRHRWVAAAASLFRRGGDFPGSVGESVSSSRCQERWGTPSGATRRVGLVLAAAASNGAGGWLWPGRGAFAQGGVRQS
jgi:hypothetical protein